MVHDIAIIGGSFAGLAAALQLVRARRRVLLIDGGRPRNRMAEAVHGIPGQDGHARAAVNAALFAGVQCYPGVYAAVYIARPFQNATLAMADGVNAAVSAHYAMVLED